MVSQSLRKKKPESRRAFSVGRTLRVLRSCRGELHRIDTWLILFRLLSEEAGRHPANDPYCRDQFCGVNEVPVDPRECM
jgi:hypothetical protein